MRSRQERSPVVCRAHGAQSSSTGPWAARSSCATTATRRTRPDVPRRRRGLTSRRPWLACGRSWLRSSGRVGSQSPRRDCRFGPHPGTAGAGPQVLANRGSTSRTRCRETRAPPSRRSAIRRVISGTRFRVRRRLLGGCCRSDCSLMLRSSRSAKAEGRYVEPPEMVLWDVRPPHCWSGRAQHSGRISLGASGSDLVGPIRPRPD
jgi:hypothetical protein